MTFIRVLLIVAAAVGLFSMPAFAVVRQVPQQFSTIQGAINAAKSGDTVLVAPGIYTENLNFRGRRIVVASNYLTNPTLDNIRNTIIDGSHPAAADSASVVRFVSGEDSTTQLIGFTLTNGIGTLIPGSFAGGGILVTNQASPRIKYNIIRGNSAISGGGIAVRNAIPTISNNAIVSNSAKDGGALFLENASVVIDHNIMLSNQAQSRGGAVYFRNSIATISNCCIAQNLATTAGGIFCESGLWAVSCCNFFANQNPEFSGCGEPGLGNVAAKKNYNLDSADSFCNIRKDPMFLNAPALDFRLNCQSRMIDAGENYPGSYPVGGAREDIGMFEFTYRTGDLSGDGRVNLADATTMINIVFFGAPVTCPVYTSDCDCNRRINIADIVALINYWSGYAETPCLFVPQSINP